MNQQLPRLRMLHLIGLTVLSVGCGRSFAVPGPGLADFEASLGNGYFINRSSAHIIRVVNEHSEVVPSKVVELGQDSVWVIAKQQHLRHRSPNNPKDAYEEPTPGAFSYWILDTQAKKVWGPLTAMGFADKRTELGIDPALSLHDVLAYQPQASTQRQAR
jgi:Protein of unknown function (DUF3997)